MNKKLFKFSLVLCASILMAVSCTKNDETPTNPDLPSMGTLTAQSGIIPLKETGVKGDEVSGEITVSGFSDGFKTAVKDKTDIKYTITKADAGGVTASAAAKTEEEFKKLITNTTFKVEIQNTFDKIKIGFAGTDASKTAQAIATAIGKGNTGSVTLTVEASGAGNTEGKYKAATFEVRLGLQVAKEE